MFKRLWGNPVYHRNHEHCSLCPGGTSHHSAGKILVPGRVDEIDGACWKIAMCKTKCDRQPALLFLNKTVGIRSGQRTNQGRFAVVDVTYDDSTDRGHRVRIARQAVTIIEISSSVTVRISNHSCP